MSYLEHVCGVAEEYHIQRATPKVEHKHVPCPALWHIVQPADKHPAGQAFSGRQHILSVAASSTGKLHTLQSTALPCLAGGSC